LNNTFQSDESKLDKIPNYYKLTFKNLLYDNTTGINKLLGYVKFIKTKQNLPFIVVHSANTAGANNIIQTINNYLRKQDKKETCVKVKVELKRGVVL
jgi:hypothetical protein